MKEAWKWGWNLKADHPGFKQGKAKGNIIVCSAYWVHYSIAPDEQFLKHLESEEFWIRELKTVYQYAQNDNIRGVGNISKQNNEIIVWKFFNKHSTTRKHRPKQPSCNITKTLLPLVIGISNSMVLSAIWD